MAGTSGAAAEGSHEEAIHYTLVSHPAEDDAPAETARADWPTDGARKATIAGSISAAIFISCGVFASRHIQKLTGQLSGINSKAEQDAWTCHTYNNELGEMDDWCSTVGVQDGWEYRMTQADGTCGPCWCCKRLVGGDEQQDEGVETDGGGLEVQWDPNGSGATLSDPVSLEDFVRDAFPGQVYDWYKRDNPLFFGTDFSVDFDCTNPNPYVYFDNPEEESQPLFDGKLPDFPMALEYMDTTSVFRPSDDERQTVIGMVEMQGPYYAFAKDLNPASPYLVMSMDLWSEELNYQFVQCALRGWPGTPSLATGEWAIRVVLKNSDHGDECAGTEAAHARCNLETSWGYDPEQQVWRSTTREVNTLIELCRQKYKCEVRKMRLKQQEGKEVPQVWLWKILSESTGVEIVSA